MDNPAIAGPCWLCVRPLGHRIEWHHPIPKCRGGRDIVPLHPICHRVIHANFSNAQLARLAQQPVSLRANPDVARFLVWVAQQTRRLLCANAAYAPPLMPAVNGTIRHVLTREGMATASRSCQD